MESIKIKDQDFTITELQTALGNNFSLVKPEALEAEINVKLAAQKANFEEQKAKIETAHGQTWKDRMQGVEGTLNGLGFSQKEGETGVQYAQRVAKDFSELKKTLEAKPVEPVASTKANVTDANAIDFELKYKEEQNKNTISKATMEQNAAAMKTLQDRLTSLDNDAVIAKKTAFTKSFVDKIKFSEKLTPSSIAIFKQSATAALNKEYDGIKEIEGTQFFEKAGELKPLFNADEFLAKLDFVKDNLHTEHKAKGVNSLAELTKLKDSKSVAKADYPLTVNPKTRNDVISNGIALGIDKKDGKALSDYLSKHPDYKQLPIDRF